MFKPTGTDHVWLSWALDLAEDAMCQEPDEFTDDDWAALGRWKSLLPERQDLCKVCGHPSPCDAVRYPGA